MFSEVLFADRLSPAFWRISLAVWMACIFILSGSWFTSEKTAEVFTEAYDFNTIIRIAAHAFEYFVLSFLFLKSVWDSKKLPLSPYLLAILFCLVYSVSDEFHQYFVPGRHFRIKDIITDTLGGTLILALGPWFHKVSPRS